MEIESVLIRILDTLIYKYNNRYTTKIDMIEDSKMDKYWGYTSVILSLWNTIFSC